MVLASLAAASCADLGPGRGDPGGVEVLGDARRAVVYLRWEAMDWGDAADRHCARYGRAARLVRMEPHRVIYDCVERPAAP